MLYCEKCHTQTQVVDSRFSKGRIRRRRVCPICKARHTTYEVLAEDFEKLQHRVAIFELARQNLKDAQNYIGDLISRLPKL